MALAFGARHAQGVLGAIEHLLDLLATEGPSCAVTQELVRLFALLRDAARIAVFGYQAEQAHTLQIHDPYHLRPVAVQQRFEPVEVALLLVVVEIELGYQGLSVAPRLGQILPNAANAIEVEPSDEVGGLGIMQAGYAVVDLSGVVNPFRADPV